MDVESLILRGITPGEMEKLAKFVQIGDALRLRRLARQIASRGEVTKEMLSDYLRSLGVTVTDRVPALGFSSEDRRAILTATRDFRAADAVNRTRIPLNPGEIDMRDEYDPSYLGSAVSKINPELAEHFLAHGINKGGGLRSDGGDLDSLNHWLRQDGPDLDREFTQVPLSWNRGQYTVYGTGGFILVSYPGEGLHQTGIGLVVANRQFIGAKDIFESRFPDVRFVFARDNIEETTREIEQQLRALIDENL